MSNEMNLRDRSAVVTGAASGIGRAIAVALARRGCHLALADVDEAGLAAHLDRLVEAEASLRRAAELWPGSERVQNDLGRVYVRFGRAADAERAFRTAIQLNSGLSEAYANLGDLLLQRGDAMRATEAFRSALLLVPRGSRAEAAIAARLAGMSGT